MSVEISDVLALIKAKASGGSGESYIVKPTSADNGKVAMVVGNKYQPTDISIQNISVKDTTLVIGGE